MPKPKIGIVVRESLRKRILADSDLQKLKEFAEVSINPTDSDLVDQQAAQFLRGMDGALSSWNSGDLTPAILTAAPKLKIWAYGAGSIKGKICDEAWEKGVIVTSGAPVIADDVAELTMGFITMGLRKVILYARAMQAGQRSPDKALTKTLFRRTVGVVSASHVGQRVMRLLRPYQTRILLYDPTLTREVALAEFGAELVDLETMACESDVVTIHAPKLPSTYQMWNETHFQLMADDSVFINTSRGANVDEEALIRELSKGRLFAFLDVTDPEPPVLTSPLRQLDNVILTPHVDGPQTQRLGERAVEELRRSFTGEEPLYRVTKEMLSDIG